MYYFVAKLHYTYKTVFVGNYSDLCGPKDISSKYIYTVENIIFFTL